MKKFTFCIQDVIYFFTSSMLIILTTGCNRMHAQYMNPHHNHQIQNTFIQNFQQSRHSAAQPIKIISNKHCQRFVDISNKPYERFVDILVKKNPTQNEVKKLEEILNDPKNSYHTMTCSGLTPIFLAVMHSNPKIVKLLLSKSLDNDIQVNTACGSFNVKYTPLMYACMANNVEMVKLLVAYPHTDIDYTSRLKTNDSCEARGSALELAVLYNSKECIPYLIASEKFHMENIIRPLYRTIGTQNTITFETLLESAYRKSPNECIEVLQRYPIHCKTHNHRNQTMDTQINPSIIFVALQDLNT